MRNKKAASSCCLASVLASIQQWITLPYGEADGHIPTKNSGSRIPSPDHYVYYLSILPGCVLWGKLCHKIKQNGSEVHERHLKSPQTSNCLRKMSRIFSPLFPFWKCSLHSTAQGKCLLNRRNHIMCDIYLTKVAIPHLHFWNFLASYRQVQHYSKTDWQFTHFRLWQ